MCWLYAVAVNLDLVAQIAVAVLGFLSASLPFLGARRARKTLREDLRLDLQLLAEVPDGRIKDRLIEHIERMFDTVEQDRERRREPVGMTLAIIFIGVSTVGGIWAIHAGGWWLLTLIVVAFVFILGAVGLARDGTKRLRDERGRPMD